MSASEVVTSSTAIHDYSEYLGDETNEGSILFPETVKMLLARIYQASLREENAEQDQSQPPNMVALAHEAVLAGERLRESGVLSEETLAVLRDIETAYAVLAP